MKLVFIHGRSQQGKDADELKREWRASLEKGLAKSKLVLPADVDVVLPFYGDRLDAFVTAFEVPLTEDVRTMGGEPDTGFLAFEAEMAEALRLRAGITDQQVRQMYGDSPMPKGPQNWRWVLAILRALDEHVPGMTTSVLESFMRDVFLYVMRSGVKTEINAIVAEALTDDEKTVVVGHSLGSVVAYSVLREDPRSLDVPCFFTLGSPLGIRPIRKQFAPLKFPKTIKDWYNTYDDRDVVALYPLDGDNFPVTPEITNSKIENHTENRHGIAGYLEDPSVSQAIYTTLC